MPAAPPEPEPVDPDPVASAPPDESEPLGGEPAAPGDAPGLVVPPLGGDADGECEVPESMPVPVDGAVLGPLDPALVLPGDDVSAPPGVDVPSPAGVCRRSRSLVDPLGACAKTGVEASVSTTRTLSHFFITIASSALCAMHSAVRGNGHADDRTHLNAENAAICSAPPGFDVACHGSAT